MSSISVESVDGTHLAVWIAGDGPPLVIVHGSMNDHSTFDPLVEELRSDLTTFAMDRRGFGASSDLPGYTIEREFEDVAAVVEAVADRVGGPVSLWGHSYGASCAMGGADLTNRVRRLILYEPSLGLTYPSGSIEKIERAVAAGDARAALLEVYRGILEMGDEEIESMRSGPQWQTRLRSAPTIAREARAEEAWAYRPGQFDRLGTPTLFLTGSESPQSVREATWRAVAAISDTRVHVFDGHGHMAHKTAPAMVAAVVREFVIGS